MKRTLLVVAVVLAIGAGAAAIAAIPGDGGVITACYNNDPASAQFGTLRVIDPSAEPTTRGTNYHSTCQSGEQQITWNQQGPTGRTGPAGPRGPSTTFTFQARGSRIYLALPGIEGDSTDEGHEGEIDIEQLSLGGSGKVSKGEIVIIKSVDKSSPSLFKGAVNGKHFAKAVLTCRKGKGKKPKDYLEITLENVVISSARSTNPPNGDPREEVTLNFAKLTETFKGKGRSSISFVPGQ